MPCGMGEAHKLAKAGDQEAGRRQTALSSGGGPAASGWQHRSKQYWMHELGRVSDTFKNKYLK